MTASTYDFNIALPQHQISDLQYFGDLLFLHTSKSQITSTIICLFSGKRLEKSYNSGCDASIHHKPIAE